MIKAPKKSPLVLRTVVLLFALVCGVHICSICLKQTSLPTKTKLLNIKVIDQPCQSTNIQQSEIPFLHYRNPVTFNRLPRTWIAFCSRFYHFMLPHNWKTFYCREECAYNPVRYFAVLSMQRSGSGWYFQLSIGGLISLQL